MTLSKDDIRASVASGTITEAQAASILAQSDARRGVRENLEGLDEPFELFKGFNEIFIVVGLGILFSGWFGVTGLASLMGGQNSSSGTLFAVTAMGIIALLARYFTLKRRMVAPSIALSLMFATSAMQFGFGVGNILSTQTPIVWATASCAVALWMLLFWGIFRVPFALLLVALSVFATTFCLTLVGGASLSDARQMFVLSGTGPFSLLTIALGLIGLGIALHFDMSDPHRVTRRAQNGFWMHIVAAPAIVNTIAITLFQSDSPGALLVLALFLVGMSLFAVIIDRRSFLVAGIGYIVALAFTLVEGNVFFVIILLGAGLVFLGAKWESIRCTLMSALPNFPGKTRLPPYAKDLS